MKKILSLFALVLMSCIGAWAQTTVELTTDESNPHYYKIESYNRGGVLTSNGAGTAVTHVEMGEGGWWYFTAADGNTTGTVAGGVIVHNNDGTQLTNEWKTAAEGSVLYILPNGVNNYGLSIAKTSSVTGDCLDANNYDTGVGNWHPSSSDWEGTTWKFTPIETGLAGYKSEAKEEVNAYYFASASLKTNACSQIDAATDEDGVDAAVAAALVAYQTEVAGKYWFIQSGYDQYYVKQSVYKCFIYNGTNKTTWGTQDELDPNCFFKLEIADNGKIRIKSNDDKYMQGVAGAMNTSAVEASLTSYSDGTFNIVFSDGTCHTEGHSSGAGISGNLVNWGGGAGSASSWKFIEKTQADYEAALNANVQITYNYFIDGVQFNTTVSTVRIGEAYPAPYDYAGYAFAGKPEGTAEENGSFDLTLTWNNSVFSPAIVEAGAFVAGVKWYYMENGLNKANGYAVYNNGDKKSTFTTTAGNTDAYMWTFVRKAGTPYFYLYNKAAGAVAMREQLSSNAGYAENHNQGYVVANDTDLDMPLELFTNGVGYGFRLADAEGTCILGKHVGSNLSIWGNAAKKDDSGSRFVFTEALETFNVAVTSAGYSTLYYDKNLAVPTGVTAYTLAENGEWLTATEVSEIPANTGVVLAAAEGNYVFEVVETAAAATSCLQGTLVEMAAPANCLVLGNEEGIGFYSYTGTLAANKAYYVNASASNLRISFGELTSIISAAQQNGGQAIFDLQGRRVVNAQNGLYIVNGKKVIR